MRGGPRRAEAAPRRAAGPPSGARDRARERRASRGARARWLASLELAPLSEAARLSWLVSADDAARIAREPVDRAALLRAG